MEFQKINEQPLIFLNPPMNGSRNILDGERDRRNRSREGQQNSPINVDGGVESYRGKHAYGKSNLRNDFLGESPLSSTHPTDRTEDHTIRFKWSRANPLFSAHNLMDFSDDDLGPPPGFEVYRRISFSTNKDDGEA